MFSKTRLKERVGYFGWEEQRFRGGRSYIPKEHKLLMRQYTAMKYQILASVAKAGEISESRLRAIVNEFLPRSRYDKLVEEAQSKVMIKQYEWDKAAKRGEFLW